VLQRIEGSTLEMDVAGSCKTLVAVCQTTYYYIPEFHSLDTNPHQNLKSHIYYHVYKSLPLDSQEPDKFNVHHPYICFNEYIKKLNCLLTIKRRCKYCPPIRSQVFQIVKKDSYPWS
jgi:hypothetical protein